MPSLPQLPTEIVSHIIKLSLPPEFSSTFPRRSAILRAFALVSPLWRVLAQEELFASPTLSSDPVAQALLDCWPYSPGERPGFTPCDLVTRRLIGARWTSPRRRRCFDKSIS